MEGLAALAHFEALLAQSQRAPNGSLLRLCKAHPKLLASCCGHAWLFAGASLQAAASGHCQGPMGPLWGQEGFLKPFRTHPLRRDGACLRPAISSCLAKTVGRLRPAAPAMAQSLNLATCTSVRHRGLLEPIKTLLLPQPTVWSRRGGAAAVAAAMLAGRGLCAHAPCC